MGSSKKRCRHKLPYIIGRTNQYINNYSRTMEFPLQWCRHCGAYRPCDPTKTFGKAWRWSHPERGQ